MTAEDLERIHAAAFGGSGRRAWSAAEFAAFLEDAAVFVCATPDGTSGFVLGRSLAGEAEMLTLAVLPEAQRGGKGRDLVAAFARAAAERGAQEAFLEVADDNVAARALYRRAGFEERGRRRAYYATSCGMRVDALVLSRALRA